MTDIFYTEDKSKNALSAAPHLRIGSPEHKRAFCGVLLDTFDPYRPAILAWPKLSAEAERRLRELPFWEVAIETEGYASSRMQAMADTVSDPLIKEALALNAFEEGRHKLVIRNMLNFYGIATHPEDAYRRPKDPEWMFLRTGYGECFDSFFSFGLFRMAKDSGYFPQELVEVFEPIVQEEARHIVFFVNWVAYISANRPFFARLWFHARCGAALMRSALLRLSLAGPAGHGVEKDNFVAAGGKTLTKEWTPRHLLEVALAENARRMARYDARLLRPRIMPFLAQLALKLLSPKQAA